VGTPEQVADRIRELDAVGVDLLLLQFSPQLEEMEIFSELVMPLVESPASGFGRNLTSTELKPGAVSS
jgi:FMNH2-dependent dimethyl sulfone monooxygenase